MFVLHDHDTTLNHFLTHVNGNIHKTTYTVYARNTKQQNNTTQKKMLEAFRRDEDEGRLCMIKHTRLALEFYTVPRKSLKFFLYSLA